MIRRRGKWERGEGGKETHFYFPKMTDRCGRWLVERCEDAGIERFFFFFFFFGGGGGGGDG